MQTCALRVHQHPKHPSCCCSLQPVGASALWGSLATHLLAPPPTLHIQRLCKRDPVSCVQRLKYLWTCGRLRNTYKLTILVTAKARDWSKHSEWTHKLKDTSLCLLLCDFGSVIDVSRLWFSYRKRQYDFHSQHKMNSFTTGPNVYQVLKMISNL